MSELIPEKGVCRIEVESTDKDDLCLDAESDIDMFEVISIEDSDVEEDKNAECENWRGVKRKSEEAGGTQCSTSQRKDVSKRDESNEITTGKRLKASSKLLEDTTVLLKQDAKELVAKQVKDPFEMISLVDNKTSIKKINGTAELSQSYLQMTNAVRTLTEGLNFLKNHGNIRGSSTSKQEEIGNSSKVDDTLSKKSITMEVETPLETISSLPIEGSIVAKHSQVSPPMHYTPKPIKNPLREFRLHKKENRTTEKTTSEPHKVGQMKKTEPSLISSIDVICVNSQHLKLGEHGQGEFYKTLIQTSQNRVPIGGTKKTIPTSHASRCSTSEQLIIGQTEKTDPFHIPLQSTPAKLELKGHGHNKVANTSLQRITPPMQRFEPKEKTGPSHTSLQIPHTALQKPLSERVSDKLSDTSPQRTTSHMQQLGQREKNEPSHTSPRIPHDVECTILQQPQNGECVQNELHKAPLQKSFPNLPHGTEDQKIAASQPLQIPHIQYDAKCPNSPQLQLGGPGAQFRQIELPHESLRVPYDARSTKLQQLELGGHGRDGLHDTSLQRTTFNLQQLHQIEKTELTQISPQIPHDNRPTILQKLELNRHCRDDVYKSSLQGTTLELQQLGHKDKTGLSQKSQEISPDARPTILQKMDLGCDNVHNMSLQKTTPLPQQLGQKDTTGPSQIPMEISNGDKPTILQHQGLKSHGQDEVRNASLQKTTKLLRNTKTDSSQISLAIPHDARSTILQGKTVPPQESVRIPHDDEATTLPKLELKAHCGNEVNNTSVQKTTPFVQNHGQIGKTGPSQISLNVPSDAKSTFFQQIERKGQSDQVHDTSLQITNPDIQQLRPKGTTGHSPFSDGDNDIILQKQKLKGNGRDKFRSMSLLTTTSPLQNLSKTEPSQTSVEIPYNSRPTILRQLELEGYERNKSYDTSLQRTTPNLQQFREKAKIRSSQISPGIPQDGRPTILRQIELESYYQNELYGISLQTITYSQQLEQKEKTRPSQISGEFNHDATLHRTALHVQQFGQKSKTEPFQISPEKIHNTRPTTLQQLEHRDHDRKLHNELTSHAKNLGQKGKTEPSEISLEISHKTRPTILQKLEPENNGRDRLNKTCLQRPTNTGSSKFSVENTHYAQCTETQTVEHVQNFQDEISNASLQMSDDVFNVKMAAEALNLLRNNGRAVFPQTIEHAQTMPHKSVFMSDVTSCYTSSKCQEKDQSELSDTSMQISPRGRNDSDSQQRKAKPRICFDSTLEITDAVTGALIPIESLYLNNNENFTNKTTDSRNITLNRLTETKSPAIPETIFQLPDTVTCVIVPLPKSNLAQNAVTTKERSEHGSDTLQKLDVIQTDIEVQSDMSVSTSVASKYVEAPLDVVNLTRNEEITKHQIESRYAALQEVEGPKNSEKQVLTDGHMQFSGSSMCVHVSLGAINRPKNHDITKEKIESSYTAQQQINVEETKNQVLSHISRQMPFFSTCVRIPLEAIFLPKCAATGVKIPSEDFSSLKNESDVIKSNWYQQKVETQSKKKNTCHHQRKKSVMKITRDPTPIFDIKKQSEEGDSDTENSEQSARTKLPLEPRLRTEKDCNEQGEEPGEISKSHISHTQISHIVVNPHYKPPSGSSENECTNDDIKQHPLEKKRKPDPSIALFQINDINVKENTYPKQQQDEGTGEARYSPQIDQISKVSAGAAIPLKLPIYILNESEPIEEYGKPSLSYPNTQVSNVTQSATLDGLNLIRNDNIKKDSITQNNQEIIETKNLKTSYSSFPGPFITKGMSNPLDTLKLLRKRDIKIERTTPQKVEENGNTKPCEKPTQMSSAIKTIRTPLEAFSLLINDNMIQRILKYTNLRISKLAYKNRRNRNFFFKNPSNENELKAFLGLLLISGALKQNQATVPEIWSECFGAGIYRATLHETRFQVLSLSICFGNNTSRDKCIIKDEFNHIEDLWDEYLNNCEKYSTTSLPIKSIEKTDSTTHETVEAMDDGHIYSTARKTVNMSLRILFSMLDGAGIRGLAMFRLVNPTVKMSQRDFLKQVGMSLVIPHLRSKMLKPTLKKPLRDLIQSILNKKNDIDHPVRSPSPLTDNCLKRQKRCQLCAWNKDRITKYQCESCQRAMCKEHRTDLCVECVKDLM